MASTFGLALGWTWRYDLPKVPLCEPCVGRCAEMSGAMVLAYIKTYYIWIVAAGLAVLIWCIREIREAQRGRTQTIFSLERELAGVRESRARLVLVAVLGVLALFTLLRFAVIPSRRLPPVREPTPTQVLILLRTSTPAPPTPTRTRIPTRPRPTQLPSAETPTSAPQPLPRCPLPGVCITSPAAGEAVKGQIPIRGTANIDAFQFYKVEYGMGEAPQQWNSIGDVQRTPVVDGVLAVWNTTGFPAGVFKLRLTVVEASGNFPPPYEIRVIVQP